VNPAELDAGIRELVMWMRSYSIPTTDSGDGVSKAPDEGTLQVPHVFAAYPAREHGGSVAAFRAAANAAEFLNYLLPAKDGTSIEITYSPRDRTVVLAVYGYTNNDVPERKS
jgi:hypothetical protein